MSIPKLTASETQCWSAIKGLLAAASHLPTSNTLEVDYSRAVFSAMGRVPAAGNGAAELAAPPEAVHRAMSLASGGSKGGFLATPSVGTSMSAMRERSPLLSLGARVERIDMQASGLILPRVVTSLTSTWQTVENANPSSATDPALGAISAMPKMLISPTIEVSEQLVYQAGERIEQLIFDELMGSMLDALTRAAVQGTGGAQPLGLTNQPSITSTAGTNLALAGVLTAQKAIVDAGVPNASALGWLASSDVAQLLAPRPRLANTEACLWSGALAAGEIEGLPARSSTHVPAQTLIHAAFDEVLIVEFSPLILRYLQHYDFAKGTSAFSAVMLVDVVARRPAAFQILTGVT